MKVHVLLSVICCLQCIVIVHSEIFSALGIAGVGLVGVMYSSMKCKMYECCTDDWIYPDLQKLNKLLTSKLFGQQIAHSTIMSALHSHVAMSNPQKALAMSFHGTGGTGKNYVAQMIADSFCKKGFKSNYCHFFNGRNDFPLESELQKYKEQLHKKVSDSILACGRSIFVFDEVDKMPKGLLSVLVPFLDYYSNVKGEYTKAIFIFLSNTGGNAIAKELINLWTNGMSRDKTKLQHFEHLITQGAFNEVGGFQHSDVIENNVIDHYIPFLPLEELHVKMCIVAEFAQRNVSKPTPEMINEALSYLTFGPEPWQLYSNGGCKRLHSKVGTIVYQWKYKSNVKKEDPRV